MGEDNNKDQWDQLAKKIKSNQESSSSSSSSGPIINEEKSEMDIDHINYQYSISDQWNKFMKQAGNSMSAVEEMIDEKGKIQE